MRGEGDSGGRNAPLQEQRSFRNFFHRNKKDALEEDLDQELAELEEGGSPGGGRRPAAPTRKRGTADVRQPPRVPPRPSPVRPAAVAAGQSPEVVNLGDLKSGKFKAAVKRAMVATRREREAAERRGRRKRREEEGLSDFQGFIQIMDPALDKTCVEYGLTADLAEAKYRWVEAEGGSRVM